MDGEDSQQRRHRQVECEIRNNPPPGPIKSCQNRIVREKGEQLVVKVPVYVTKVDDAACELRGGFVRVHDAAARNQSPEPPGESDSAAAGVALSEAAAVIASNYAACHVAREQVLGWQEFWGRYSDALKSAVCLPKDVPAKD